MQSNQYLLAGQFSFKHPDIEYLTENCTEIQTPQLITTSFVDQIQSLQWLSFLRPFVKQAFGHLEGRSGTATLCLRPSESVLCVKFH